MARTFLNQICSFAFGSFLLTLSSAYCQCQQYDYSASDSGDQYLAYDDGNQYQGGGYYNYGDGRSIQQSNERDLEFPGRYSQGGDYRLPNSTDWDYYQSWRNYRESYYRGDTQPQAYRESHPYGTGGIGYDPDPTYLRMEEAYRRLNAQEQQGGNPNNPQGGGYFQSNPNDGQQRGKQVSRGGGGGGSGSRKYTGKYRGGGSPRKYPYAQRSKNYDEYWDYSR